MCFMQSNKPFVSLSFGKRWGFVLLKKLHSNDLYKALSIVFALESHVCPAMLDHWKKFNAVSQEQKEKPLCLLLCGAGKCFICVTLLPVVWKRVLRYCSMEMMPGSEWSLVTSHLKTRVSLSYKDIWEYRQDAFVCQISGWDSCFGMGIWSILGFVTNILNFLDRHWVFFTLN